MTLERRASKNLGAHTPFFFFFLRQFFLSQGWQWGRAGRRREKGWGLYPCPARFCLALSPFRACETLPQPVQLYFLLTCFTTIKFFLMKPVSLIKIYFILQLNLSHQIKLIFSKNFIILSKKKKKKKSHSLTHNKIKVVSYVGQNKIC